MIARLVSLAAEEFPATGERAIARVQTFFVDNVEFAADIKVGKLAFNLSTQPLDGVNLAGADAQFLHDIRAFLDLHPLGGNRDPDYPTFT